MTELRMQLEDEFITNLRTKLRVGSNTDVVREALTILNWAAQEREQGRVILSATPDGQSVVRLALPALENAAGRDGALGGK